MENSGIACLRLIAEKLHWAVNFDALITEKLKEDYASDPVACVAALAEKLAWMPTLLRQSDANFLQQCKDPVILQMRSGRFVFVFDPAFLQKSSVRLLDPSAAGNILDMPVQELKNAFSGTCILLKNLRDVDPKKYTGLFALDQIGRHYGMALDLRSLVHDHAAEEEEFSPERLCEIAEERGFKSKLVTLQWHELEGMKKAFPFAGFRKDGKVFILCGMKNDPESGEKLAVLDITEAEGSNGALTLWTEEKFRETASGRFLLLKRLYKLTDEERPFSLGWFLPEFWKLGNVFSQIILLVVLSTLLALGIPLFFQVIVDKVLVHKGFSTLNVLGIGVVITVLFNNLFGYMRSYLLLFATNKIDINTASKTFRKLVHLPLDFFERNSSGILLKHMQQTEKIRGFLSGNLFFTLLDLFSLVVFLPFLLMYSIPLTGIVLFFSFLMALVVVSLIKPFQKRLNELYLAEGKRQSMLVETLHGMRTVKSLAVEPVQEKEWDNTTASAVNACFRVGKISIAAKNLSTALEGLMLIAVIWCGALLYFKGYLSIGSLIAFQMLAGRVTSPLIRLSGLIHEYQQIALSVQMLGVVMNTRPEPGGEGLRPAINGAVSFENVSFRYIPDRPYVIRDFNMQVEPGAIIGIVGRSGSGKTTLTKLLQGLYPLQSGMIKIDGIDLREISKSHLRSRIGIVLQENYFFTGTIRSNIGLSKPQAASEEIIYAARLAGAHEFISELPKGYDTMLDENASNLSGGQKQRLAIARALLANPPILIFDEATSALDPESENIIRKNLQKIAKGRTVFIISHRLSIVRNAKKIIVLDRGRISEQGNHRELLAGAGIYRDFWQQQMEGES